MSIEKAEIISGTLTSQADETDLAIESIRKEMHEHSGASRALGLMAKQMPELAKSFEARIEADTDLSSAAAEKVRSYVKNLIARFQIMCDDNARDQRNTQLRFEGKLDAMISVSKMLRSKSETAISFATRREELKVEREAEEAAKAAEKIPPNGVAKKTRKPRKQRKAK